MEGIVFVDRLPVVSIDATGVTLVAGSGNCSWKRRFDRALWRKLLETELRQLNAWEAAERREMGRVLAFKKQG